MRVVPLAPGPTHLLRNALVRRGLNPARAEAVSRGLGSQAVLVDGIRDDARDALAGAARVHGLNLLSGRGWALVAGDGARLGALMRPGGELPASLAEALGPILRAGLDPAGDWETSRGTISLDLPVVVGVVNVTPDSFSDGGRFLAPDAALAHAERLLEAGAGMLDIGAESTRPGQKPVPQTVEWERLAPVIAGVVERFPGTPLSVDTVKPETARRALEAGAWAINDVSGLRLAPGIAQLCASHGAGLLLMHSRGIVSDMASYEQARYTEPVFEVVTELMAGVTVAEEAGVARERIVLDPGLGFAKTPDQTLEVFRGLPSLTALGFPVMVGPSRKRFLGAITGRPVEQRDLATAAACVAAYAMGARLFRVHAVEETAQALQVAVAVQGE